MKLPRVPLKNWAAMGGAEMINMVSSRPMPPCSMDWVVMPSLWAPTRPLMVLAAHSPSATLMVTFSTTPEMKLSVAMANRVPMP